MIPPRVPQAVRLDSKYFHLLNWSHSTVPMALNSLWTTGRFWICVHHDPVTCSLLPPECWVTAVSHLTRPGNVLLTNHYWHNLCSIKTWLRVGDAAQSAQHAPSSEFAPQHQIKGKGGPEVQGCRKCEPRLSCESLSLCTFTRLFS